jgi:hypothetical protein
MGCGSSENVSEVKIKGGTEVGSEVMDERRLSTVALTTDVDFGKGSLMDKGHSFCTGTIAGPRVVVTAAHCIQAFDPGSMRKKDKLTMPEVSDFVVFFGTKVSTDGTWIRAAEVIPHPDWNVGATLWPFSTVPANDIGVIILAEDIPAGYRPAPLADLNWDLRGQELIFAGFGITSSMSRDDTGTLRQAEVPLLSVEKGSQRIVSGKAFEGVCSGDSGGPAYVKKDGKLYFTGIASTGAMLFGRWCLGFRNAHIDARYYGQWITKVSQ